MKPQQTFLAAVILSLAMLTNVGSAQDVTGQWSGRWHSGANNHSGKISATFCQTSPGTMQARFQGSFAKVIPFRYRTNLNITSQQPGLTIMSGSRRLPLGGEFKYDITMTDECFNGTFSSRRNRGTFVMQRK